jgi:S-DNA-T family DNA segregation ATPase FtsK/SpoIIIE
MTLGVVTATFGVYLLIAVLAYFVSYTEDVAALEGAPSAVPLHNPTGWIGARLAHWLVYRGFGWIGVLFPLLLTYMGIRWVQGRPVKRVYLLFGLAALYFFSTLGAVLAQIGLVEDLLWCGVVGAAFADLLVLYIGKVGLLLSWGLLVGGVGYFFWRLRKRQAQVMAPAPEPAPDAPLAESLAEEPTSEAAEPNFFFTIRPLAEPVHETAASDAGETWSASAQPSESISFLADKESAASAQPLASISLPADKEGAVPDEGGPAPISTSPSESPQAEPLRSSFSPPRSSQPLPLQNPLPSPLSSAPSARAPLQQWIFPPITLLDIHETRSAALPTEAELEAHKNQIVDTLSHYGISITRITATVGPTVTLFEIVPAPGIRISRIRSLEDDIALSLAALGIRIIAPLPGKGTIGIEVPHKHPQTVSLRGILASKAFQEGQGALLLGLGKTISNEAYIRDLAQMPHLLIAGATGQGKSVALNCMILSLLYRRSPHEVRFLLIDPKKVEMSLYQHLAKHYLVQIPTLPSGIITEVEEALPALQSLVLEMELRYDLLKEARVRNITEYNEAYLSGRLAQMEGHRYLPYIVLIIDELADLMMTAGKEVETPICRLAQLARAVGIHLIVATQRPSVNVITGLIKANFPVRISFRVSSGVDSRTILDVNGAERLMGRGDMLFSMGTEMLRLQSGFVSTAEIERVVAFIENQPAVEPYILPEPPRPEKEEAPSAEEDGERDPLFYEAALLVVRSQYGSTSLLQRKLGVGFNRAGRLMDQLEKAGIVGPARGSKPREVLIQDESLLEAYR